MASILVDNFNGEFPKTDARLLPDNGAQIAHNCDLRSGKLVPENGPLTVFSNIPADTKTLYGRRTHDWHESWGEGFTTDWVTWSDLTYFFESPFAKETLNRLYTLKFIAEETFSPMQYEGTGITLQDLTFTVPVETISATYVDRNDPIQNADDIVCRGDVEATSVEEAGSSVTVSLDGIICVGSANPSNNVINGNPVSFDYNVNNYSSTDGGTVYTLDSTTTGTYTGSVLYAGGTTLFINPSISKSHTSGGANFIKITLDADGNDITMQATGSAFPPVGEILDRYYVWTYVFENGEESPPSPTSNLATIYKGDAAELANVGSVTGPAGAVKKRIYTTSGGTFKVVGEIDVAETTFTDDVATSGLYGELLVANNPQDMHGMILSPLGFTIGWNGRDILFANEYIPYAWNDGVTITVKSQIVGMVAVNDIVYVLTEGTPYILSGFSIDSMTLEEIPEPQSCISKVGIVRYKNSAYYVSPDGIIQLSGGSSKLFTRGFFNKKTWESLQPIDSALAVQDDILHFVSGTEHYRFSLAESTMLTRGDLREPVLWQDIRRDGLFFKDGTDIKENLGDSGTIKVMTWKSKEFDFKSDMIMSVGRVIANSYNNVTLNTYADGVLVSTNVVTNDNPFRLASTGRHKTWSMEVVAQDTISSLQIGQTMVELK